MICFMMSGSLIKWTAPFRFRHLLSGGEEVEPPRALPCGVSTFPLFPQESSAFRSNSLCAFNYVVLSFLLTQLFESKRQSFQMRKERLVENSRSSKGAKIERILKMLFSQIRIHA